MRALSALIASLALLAGAAPDALAGPVDDFRQDGVVDVCRYSQGELERAGNSLPPDVIQYSPGLADQLSAGREGCSGGGSPGGVNPRQTVSDPADTDQDGDIDSADAAAAGGGSGGARGGGSAERAGVVPDPPSPSTQARTRLADIATPSVAATSRSDVPGWVLTLLIALGLGALLFTLLRFSGLSGERFTTPLKASFGEAGGRIADALSEVWDSVRLGR